jgi:prepilin-type N-terminal cleavage/methylation domain-containing protein
MARGFSLLEVLVATTILVVGVAGLAPLFVLASRANRTARTTTVAVLLAEQKMEQLRALTWRFDAAGAPVGLVATDLTTDLTVVPEAAGGTGLTPSPAGALDQNILGYCDFVDEGGHPVGGGTAAPPGAIYARRWSIDPLPESPANTLVLQVLVTRLAVGAARLPDAARLASIKTRKAD